MKKLKSDLRIVTLEEMTDMLNEVAESEHGSITVESEGIINFPMAIYTSSQGSEWYSCINSKIKDEILYEDFMIIDDSNMESDFVCDSLEIIGDILYIEATNQFKFCLGGIDLEIVISVYDYYFESNVDLEER